MDAVQKETERVRSIVALCEKHRMRKEVREHLIQNNFSIEQSRNYVLEQITGRQQEPIGQPVNPLSVGLSEKEQSQYSLCRAILALSDRNGLQNCFEAEVSADISKKLGRSSSGLFVPLADLKIPAIRSNVFSTRATYSTGLSATGGATVPTILDGSNLIEFLRNRMLMARMGMTTLSGLTGNFDLPRVTSTSGLYWVSEGGSVGRSESQFDLVSLRPKTAGNISTFTRQMLLQSSLDVEAFVRKDLADTIAVGIDRAILVGSGVGSEPLGILNNPGIPVHPLGTNGGALSWANVVRLETLVSRANADIGSLGYICSPDVRGILKTTSKVANGVDARFIWEDGADPSEPWIGRINGYVAGATNQIPINLTKGSGTNLSAIIFGNFGDVLMGSWQELELLSNPYGQGFDSGNIEIRALQTLDIAIRRNNSFAVIKDAQITV